MRDPHTIMVLAGEVSGDLLGAELIRELKTLSPSLTSFGMGGPRMQEAGVRLSEDATRLSVVGFLEVLKRLPAFRALFHSLLEEAKREKPDAVVLIDNPGFNLRFAKTIRPHVPKIAYYVSP